MISRLAELLRHTSLSPARRIFAMQKILERAAEAGRVDLCQRILPLMEQELLRLRHQHPLAIMDHQIQASNEDCQTAFVTVITDIAANDPTPQIAHLLEPVFHQLLRLRDFRERSFSSTASGELVAQDLVEAL